MKPVPDSIQKPYVDFVKKSGADADKITVYIKWLKFYLHFCRTFSYQASSEENLTLFLNRLKPEYQTAQHRLVAKKSIHLFYQLTLLLTERFPLPHKTWPLIRFFFSSSMY